MSKPIRILVAEDHPVVRDGLVAVLSTQSDFAVVGEAGNGAEVVQKAADLRPDMVLLDLEMPGMDGVEALHQMQTRSPKVRIIVFTSFDSDDRILAAVQAGVQGYILKGAPREQLFEALRVVPRRRIAVATRGRLKAAKASKPASGLFSRFTNDDAT